MKFSRHLTMRCIAVLTILLLIPPGVSAQWIRKADALKIRSEQGETIVYNSKIYAFTGFSDPDYHAEPSSEVYDPASDSWAYIASLPPNTAMTHQDIILVDNTIWLIGGRALRSPGTMTSVIWIYNIATNTWSPGPGIKDPATGNPLVIAASASALLGRVLHIFGGFTPDGCNNDQSKYHLTLDVDTWLANPSSAPQWENKLMPLPKPRNHLSGLTLGGKIYAIGGQTGHDCGGGLVESADCHVYDPSTDSWRQLPSLPSGRSHAEGSTFALDGKIYLVAGQQGNNKACKLVTLFNPAANNGLGAWGDDASLTLPFIYEGCSATVVDNALIVSHGSQGSSKYGLKATYTTPITRNPVYKLGFPAECLQVSELPGTMVKAHTWLHTINGTKEYTISSDASWLEVSKNATGIANPNSVEIELAVHTTGLAPGNYSATITATGSGSGIDYTPATFCVQLNVKGEPPVYQLLVASDGAGQVSKDPDKASYTSGDNVTLTAIPDQGQQFNGWSGNVSSTTNPLTITIDADKSVVATFTPIPQYTLSVSANGNGSVNVNPNQNTYNSNTAVTLTAVAAAGRQFSGWSGDAGGNANPLTVNMTSNKNITANFIEASFTVSNITAASGRSYQAGRLLVNTPVYTDRTYKATAVPANLNNALFIQTPNADKSTASASMFSFTINNSAIIYAAYDPRGTVLPAWLSGWQKLTGQTIGVNDPYVSSMQLYKKDFSAGTVTLGGNLQSPAKGALNNYFVIIVPAATYSLDITTTGNGLITKNPNQSSYSSGSGVILAATAAGGQQFAGWSGDANGNANPLSITMNANKNITANFDVAGEYSLAVSTTGNGNVNVSPDKASYTGGSTVTLTATPSAGQQFNGWSGDASGSTNPLTLIMNGNKNITANFVERPFAISGIVASSGRSYLTGQLLINTTIYTDRTYQATAVPAGVNNALFIKTPNADKSTTSASMFSFTMNGSATIYIAYDPRGTVLPAWLSSWQKLSGQTIGVNDPYVSFMQLYKKDFSAGAVTLGGNLQAPAKGALNNYFVVIVPVTSNNLGITMQSRKIVHTPADPFSDNNTSGFILPVMPFSGR